YRIWTAGSNYLTFFFFFQAEDGIRDRNVTGVQTCALPILQDALDALGPLDAVVMAPLADPAHQRTSPLVEISEAQWRAQCEAPLDRKSTRLNSSHVSISYAVFCLKKKHNNKNRDMLSSCNL